MVEFPMIDQDILVGNAVDDSKENGFHNQESECDKIGFIGNGGMGWGVEFLEYRCQSREECFDNKGILIGFNKIGQLGIHERGA